MIVFAISVISLVSFGQQKTLHDFKTKTLEDGDFDLSTLKGKKVLVVNTASKCGHTPQYAELEALYKKYGGDKFVIIGFPANNFLKQAEIAAAMSLEALKANMKPYDSRIHEVRGFAGAVRSAENRRGAAEHCGQPPVADREAAQGRPRTSAGRVGRRPDS